MRRLLIFSLYLPWHQGQRMTLCTIPRTVGIVACFIAVAWASAG
jgi:hypothetical protein